VYYYLMAMDYGLTIHLAGEVSVCLCVCVCVCVIWGGGVLEHCASHWEVPMWLSRCWAWKKRNETLKAEGTSSGHGNQFVVKLEFAGIKLLYCLQTI
jgi:hypothetical protein